MAINYTFSQVVSIIAEGKDKEALMDIGRRFPLLMNKVSVLSALAGDAFVDFAKAMPEYLTAMKVNNALKDSGDAAGAEDEGNAGAEDSSDEGDNGGGYDSMNGKQLMDLVRERNLVKKLPKPFKKADMVKVLKEADAQSKDDEDDTEETEETSNPYEGKSAVELFKECKKRGLKAVPKKPAKFYADMLVKDDAAKAAEDEDDDWGDGDDAEDTKSAKVSKPGKGAKTAKKEEDDDEDWDI